MKLPRSGAGAAATVFGFGARFDADFFAAAVFFLVAGRLALIFFGITLSPPFKELIGGG